VVRYQLRYSRLATAFTEKMKPLFDRGGITDLRRPQSLQPKEEKLKHLAI
jgi:hypothetical protein